MNKDNYSETIDKLNHDYLELCESYMHDLPVHEFGFAMIRIVSKMLIECAPNIEVAQETVNVAFADALRMHKEDSE